MKVTIEIDQADNVSSDLADLLYWWQGFKLGLRFDGTDEKLVADNGIEAAREINLKIRDQLRKLQ